MQGITVLAVLSDHGMQIWSSDGETMIFVYPIAHLFGSDNPESSFLKGVSSDGQSFFVGASNGLILVYDCTAGMHSANFPIVQRLESENNIAIASISSSENYVGAANDNGSIFAYRIKEGYFQSCSFAGDGTPVTSLAQNDTLIMAGYSSGLVRIYRLDINELCIEITAHVRLITAIDYQEHIGLLATVSMDQQLMVWSIPNLRSKVSGTVNCVFAEALTDKLCTGVAFVGENRLAVSCYDEEEISLYIRS